MSEDIILKCFERLNKKLPDLLKKKGMTWADLADKLGVTQGAVSKAKKMENNWGLDKIVMMSELFGESLDWLLLDKEVTDKKTDLRRELLEVLKENEKLKEKLKTFDKMKELLQ